MRIKTIKTLFITLLMCLSSVGAWADTKIKLYSTDFESGIASDYWKNGNGYLVTPTNDGSTGVCASIKNSSDKGDYFLTNADYTDVDNYSIEFDFLLNKGSKTAELAVMSESAWSSWTFNWGYKWDNNRTQAHNPYLLYLSIAGNSTTAVFNDSETTYTFTSGKWYHFKLDIDALNSKVEFSIVQKGEFTSVLTGEYTLLEGESPYCKGFYERNNRYNYDPGAICLDNVDIYTVVQEDVAQNPIIELKKVNGTVRTYSISFIEGETLHYKLPGSDEYLTTTETPCEVTVSESGTLYAYTTKGTATSEVVETIVDATEILLPTPEIKIGFTQDGDKFIPLFGAVSDNSSVLLNPEIAISATLDGVDVTSAVLAGNYTPANSGTLTVTATAEGYTSSTSNMFVAAEYSRSWQSVDFSTITIDNVAEYFGDGWSVSDNTGRWASWAEQTYSYIEYKTNGGDNITINDRIRMRDVVSVNVGYGLGRNLGAEKKEGIRVLNVKTNEITEFRIYNGYGKRTVAEGSCLSYVVGDGGDVYMYSNNGALLVQASVYTPMTDYEIHYTYNSEVVYVEKGRAAKGTVITASKTVEVDELKKFTVVEEPLPTMTIVDGINLLYVPVRFSGHTKHTNVLYERGTSEETKWTEENLSDFTGNVLTLSDYGASYITNANSGDKSTRIISPTEGAVINVDAYWYGISNTGRAFSAGNGIYFRFGNVFIAQNDQDQKHGYGLNGITNMGSVVKFSGTNAYRNNDISKLKFLHIEMQINTATDMLEYLKVSEEGSDVYLVNVENKQLENADYETIEWGYKKGGSISTERQSYLKSIKVTETVRGLYERGVYTEWSETDLGDNGWKVEVTDKTYPARPFIDENLGLSLLSQVRNQEISYTLPVEPSEESVIVINAEWYVGGTTGGSGNKTYFKIGDQIEFSAMPQDQKGAVTINGVEYVVNNACGKNNGNRTDDTWNIKLVVNTATDMITKLSGSSPNSVGRVF